ncbi:SUMF1/EgtB/PvdO family nonheme iron enzyme [Oryzibacter oryziterrae]|uniref:SUMF1/EgtB/PvdO family nonheme iron enzyme n=1 Tax=Oryzibacter oryziterrae TaxID=2766474 RepID=UPI001F489763|nr:SUMF1/EgtB/PvdO family nonheme iron enzyme [Oryzibacter oryziterrae]
MRLLSALMITLAMAVSAHASTRVALVIGNGGYEKLSRLENPTHDAEAVAGMLRANGFDVEEATDLTRADFLDSLEAFQAKASGAELAVVYYAGHGMEVDGKDVLAPVDMELSCETREAKRSVPLSALFEAADGAQSKVVLLDACRSDPFPSCPKRGTEDSGFRGLTRVNSSGSTLIASATLSGSVAADGKPGQHSPFTQALLARFENGKTVPFRDLLDQVAEDVRVATDGVQIPEVTSRGGAPKICLAGENCDGAQAEPLTRVVMNVPATKVVPQTDHSVGSSFRDCSDCPEMVVLPAGSFKLGSPATEVGRDASEGPQVDETIAKPFAVSKTEITFDAFETCRMEGGCPGETPKDAGWGRGNRPVIYVDHADAEAYAAWLTASTGHRYRLLTEAEWEYAARGGTTTPYPTGTGLPKSAANVDFSQSGDVTLASAYLGKTSEVGAYPPNPFGLQDMTGNVAEWVADCWSPDHAGAPADGTSRGGDCTRRVVKGGAWYFEPAAARSAARASYPSDKRLNVIGFRVAREIETTGEVIAPAPVPAAVAVPPVKPAAKPGKLPKASDKNVVEKLVDGLPSVPTPKVPRVLRDLFN